MRVAHARLLAVAIALLASRGEAAVQFDFTGGSSSSSGSVWFVGSDSISQVEVRGFSGLAPGGDAPLTAWSSARVDQYAGSGLQVQFTSANDVHADIPSRCRPESRGDWNGSSGVLATEPKVAELLQFNFGMGGPVVLKQVAFSGVQDGFDEFDLSVDGVDVDINALFGFSDPSNPWNNGSIAVHGVAEGDGQYRVYFPQGLPMGEEFSFYLDDLNDQYRISSLVVERLYAPAVSHNPEPAGLMIWSVMGVGGLVARRRRA